MPDARSHFHEFTLPTSFAWAVLVSQCSAAKKESQRRKRAGMVLFEVLMASFRQGNLEIQIQEGNVTNVSRVPGSGMVPASLLLRHLTPKQLNRLKDAWMGDCKDSSPNNACNISRFSRL